MIKWESVFFRRDQKPRRWVPHKNRYDMQCDFLTLAGVVTDLTDKLNEIDPDNNAERNASGIN